MDKDPVIEPALRTLTPPAPDPAFWAEVHAALGMKRARRRTLPWWTAGPAAILRARATFAVANSLQGDSPLCR